MARIPKHPSKRKYQLQHLFERHHQMARLVLLGFSNKEIAEQLGCTPQNVSDVRNSEVFQAKLEILREGADSAVTSVEGVLGKEAIKSLDVLRQVRDGELTSDVKVRVQVAQDLLSRAGHSPIARVKGSMAHAHLGLEDINKIKEMSNGRRPVEADATVVEEE